MFAAQAAPHSRDWQGPCGFGAARGRQCGRLAPCAAAGVAARGELFLRGPTRKAAKTVIFGQ